MKIVSIVGARPQFVKAAVVSRVLRLRHQEVLVRTGSHDDHTMINQLFDQLESPEPNINLRIGSHSSGAQTAAMMES